MGAMAMMAMPYVLGGAASAVVSNMMSGGSPQMLVEKPPAPAGTNAPSGAQEQQKKKAAGAMGRADTIATGPKGLGEIGQENLAPKTLLGY